MLHIGRNRNITNGGDNTRTQIRDPSWDIQKSGLTACLFRSKRLQRQGHTKGEVTSCSCNLPLAQGHDLRRRAFDAIPVLSKDQVPVELRTESTEEMEQRKRFIE